VDEDRSDQAGETVPFDALCERCGAHINDPDKLFGLGACAVVPDSECLLLEAHCLTCDTTTDVCLWLGDRNCVLSEAGPPDLAGLGTPEGRELLDRFDARIAEYRRACDPLALDAGEQSSLDLGAVAVEFRPSTAELPAFPARVLAAARGARQAVETYPAQMAPAALCLGRFRCVLSVDRPAAGPGPWTLHLSVSNARGPAPPSKGEQYGLLTLFFAPAEVPRIWGEPGLTAPIIHFRLEVWPATGRVRIADRVWLQPDASRVLVFCFSAGGAGEIPSVTSIDRAAVKGFLDVLTGEAGEATTGDGSLGLQRSGAEVGLRVRPFTDLAGAEVVRLDRHGLQVFQQVLESVAASPAGPAEADSAMRAGDESQPDEKVPEAHAHAKLALRAAYMLKTASRLRRRAAEEGAAIGSVDVETGFETMMRPGWEPRLGAIGLALGEAAGELARTLSSRWRAGAPGPARCEEFVSTHGPWFRLWALLVGKHLLPVLQRALMAESPGLSVSYRFGRFYVQQAAARA